MGNRTIDRMDIHMGVTPGSTTDHERSLKRRDLLGQYVHLQRELIEGDPGSGAYHAAVQAFRQMGYMLIAQGLEADLDRLLRLRVLEGGQPRRCSRDQRAAIPELTLIEQRPPS